MRKDGLATPDGLIMAALGHALALIVAVSVGANISGGHVNPAVTFSMAIGGHISVPTALFYWISQLLASVMACLLLRVAAVGQVIQSLDPFFHIE